MRRAEEQAEQKHQEDLAVEAVVSARRSAPASAT